MLGRYENFPEVTHGRAHFTCRGSVRDVQQAILCGLHRLNHKVCRLDIIASHLPSNCEVGFEFGVAEDMVFNYLDKRELERFKKRIAKEELPIMDFFCAIHYHTVNKNGKRVPLKFDYHLIRFMFRGNSVELRICHERGSQRVPLEELITFIANNINEELSQKRLKLLDLEYLRAL